VNNGCTGSAGTLVLDGSPTNAGYIMEGSQSLPPVAGGWAFQLCDAGGCSGGFETEPATSTPTTTPTGASSVLFLPGIQASRLYKANFAGDGNDQVWPPNALFNEDIYDLSMDVNGVSAEQIYTGGIMETAPGGTPVYAGLKNFLDNLKTEGTIDDWTPYAYDWRYAVTDVAQNGTRYSDVIKDAVVEIENLAEGSLSEKVTIIGHSNGGLLAKAIMRRLEEEGKANLVDKVVLLASPQLGTPKAIGTMLHGYDQTDPLGGFFMDGQIVREVINNIPGTYGLLPSEKYFEGLDVPLVTFKDTAVTAPYRQTYGATISSFEDYVRFLQGEDGFDRDFNNPISVPAKANAGMLDGALSMHEDKLDSWVAPDGVEVTEIVGTGLSTMKSVEYREVVEDRCLGAGPAMVCTEESEIKPYAVLTKYGDATVVQRSAEAYGGEKKKYFVNLAEIKKEFLTSNFEHYNITEAQPVQDLLDTILTSTTTENNQFISTAHTEFNDSYDIEMIDSPVRILVTDTSGNQTGVALVNGEAVVKQGIPGSQYFEFGDTKYLLVPKGINRTTKLDGEDYGGYTLTTATLGADDVQEVKTILVNATTTPDLIAEYSNTNSEFSTVMTDEDGDGEVDYEMSLDGEIIKEEVVVVTYPLLVATVEGLNLSKSRKQALLLLIKSADYYGSKVPTKPLYLKLEDALLQSARDLVKLYEKKRYLTTIEAADLQIMIQVLKDKQ
jgi:pimeloyl-ACP methyl ester carboxylesterase